MSGCKNWAIFLSANSLWLPCYLQALWNLPVSIVLGPRRAKEFVFSQSLITKCLKRRLEAPFAILNRLFESNYELYKDTRYLVALRDKGILHILLHD